MSAIPFEALLPQSGQLTSAMAQRWIIAALAVARALHEHDAGLYPADPICLPAARELYDAWRRWSEGADALLHRARLLSDAEIPEMNLLRDEIGRIQSMLGMPPDLIAKRREQALRGDVRPLEEVRRELRAGDRR